MFQRTTELIGARGAAHTAMDAIELADDIVDVLTGHQLADALQVAITASYEEDLLDNVVLIGRHIYQLRTSALCFV